MADCLESVIQDVVATCDVQGNGGNEIKAWLLNLEDKFSLTFDVTNPSKITSIVNTGAVSSGVKAYTLTTSRKGINTGSDLVSEVGRGDRYTHFAAFSAYAMKAADVEAIDKMNNFMIIVESRDKTDDGDGVFKAYGVKYGLFKSADTNRANDANGSRPLEFTSQEGDTEKWSSYTVIDTDYATTKALLEGLETPA